MDPGPALAAAQTVPARGDVEANLGLHLELVRAAAAEGAGLLLFPELSLTGYELDLAAELAFAPDDARLSPLVEAASEGSMTIVAGAPVRVKGHLHIGAFIIGPDGKIDIYTKHHLGAFSPAANPGGSVPPAEAGLFEPGTHNPLLDLDGVKAALAICADTGHASHARQAAERGARLYLAGMFVIPGDLEKETATLQSHARRHAMTVLFANYGGPSGGLPPGGRSGIWSPEGECLARLGAGGTGLVIARGKPSGWEAKALSLTGP